MTSPLAVTAPAKLNLSLHITGRRSDGFHLLDSIMVFTEFGDTLEIFPADLLTLNVTGPFADSLQSSEDQNLVMRAASMLRLRTGCTQGARMVLNKQIPVGAGLGGGSSDAAAALKGLRKFWKLDIPPSMLHSIAMKLGSDVPGCMVRRPVWVRGIGERVTPITIEGDIWTVIVNPGVPLLTEQVYKRFTGSFSKAGSMASHFASPEALVEALKDKRNDLQAPATELLPVIHDVLAAIQSTRNCLFLRMSGSGPSCFGFYAGRHDAEQAASNLSQLHPAWWCMATKLHDWSQRL